MIRSMAKHTNPSSTTCNRALGIALLVFLVGILISVIALAGHLSSEIVEALITLLRVAISVLNLNR